jgi:hypothetical protein
MNPHLARVVYLHFYKFFVSDFASPVKAVYESGKEYMYEYAITVT